MKKFMFLMVLVMATFTTSFAQTGGLFQRGSEPNETDTTKGGALMQQCGEEDKQNKGETPVGSGIAIMTSLGAMYLIGKKRKN